MPLALLLKHFRDWRERRVTMAELRRLNRENKPYRKIEIEALVDAVRTAAYCEDAEATLIAFDRLQSRAPDVALTSEVAIRSLLSVGKIDLAESVVKEGLRKFPGARDLLLLHGEVAYRRRDWPEMIRRFAVMRRKFRGDVWGYTLGGVALREHEQFDAADKLLKRAVGMEPLLLPPAVEYARVAERRDDLEEALRRWAVVRERFEDRIGWIEAARTMCRMGREDEAIALLNNAQRKFPNKSDPSVELARISYRRGNLEEAVRMWQTVRVLFPQDEVGYVEGVGVLRQLGRHEEADEILRAYTGRRGLTSVATG
jgi:tetratricopeptide (TPR) repeat protein